MRLLGQEEEEGEVEEEVHVLSRKTNAGKIGKRESELVYNERDETLRVRLIDWHCLRQKSSMGTMK